MPAMYEKQGTIMTDAEDGNGLDLLNSLVVLTRHKRLVLGILAACVALALLAAFLLPARYTAETQVFAPDETANSALTALADLGSLAGLSSTPAEQKAEVWSGVLKSRTVADVIVRDFNLRKLYKVTTDDEARSILAGNTDVGIDKSGIVSIDVIDRDPKRAADIANAYVAELNRNMVRMQTGNAMERGKYFEQQNEKAHDDLVQAEFNLQKVQERTGVLQIDAQAEQALESEALLRAQLATREAAADAMSSYMTPDNPALKYARQEEAALRKQVTLLHKGGDEGSIGMGQLPEKGMAYVNAYRNVKYREAIYEITVKQLESARLDAANKTDAVQVLDVALPPQKRSSPKRVLILLLGILAGIALGTVAAFSLEAYHRWIDDPERRALLQQIREEVRR